MRRLAMLVSVFVVLGSLLAYARDNPATAQDAMAPHPVVGAWRVENDLGGGDILVSYGIFHPDGSYIEALDNGLISIGVWQPTGERTADLTVFNQYVIDGQIVQGEGRLAIEVDETGNSQTAPGTFVGSFPDGTIDIALETQSPGTRLEVLPVVPLDTLVPATPAP